MIKGHVCIDLHNHNSGFTERIEKDNLVTNATQEVLNLAFGSNNKSEIVMPIYAKVLGGLMLFDNDLTEDVNNIALPNNAHLVGYAMQDQSASDVLRGSYNYTESHANDDGFTTVWDFGTSQANGTIKSLARTLNTGGCLTRGVFGTQNTSITHIIDGDVEKQEVYSIKYDGDVKVQKWYRPLTMFTMSDTPNVAVLLDGNVATIDLPTDGGFRNVAAGHIRSGYDGYSYVSYVKMNATGDGVFKYRRVKTSDRSFTLEPEVSVTCPNCHFTGGSSNVFQVNDFDCVTICKGYAYVISYDRRGVYIINLSNTSDIKLAPFGDTTRYYNILRNFPSGVVKASDNYSYNALVYSDGKVVPDNYQAYSNYPEWGDGVFMFNSNSIPLVAGGYLGTICNLSSEVVKTVSQSMKITYTLTRV